MNNLLETNKIKLRAVELSDVDLLYQWENDTSVWKVSNTLVPFSRFAIQKFVESCQVDIFQTKQLRLIIEVKDSPPRPIGCIDLFDYEPLHKRAGVGILISYPPERGKGYASDALDSLIEYCKNILQIHMLFCNIAPNNLQSIHLFEKKGFVKTGVKRDWTLENGNFNDELMYQIIL